MSSLKNKLNALVRARIQGILGDDPDHPRSPRKPPVDKRADNDVAALRRKINAALDDEERMAAEIETLQRQIADLDQQADRAMTTGDEASARRVLRQMQLDQQRITMLEADLAEHRRSISELISQVNAMEAAIAEARQQQAAPERAAPPDAAAPPADQATRLESDARPAEDDLALRRARLSQKE